MATGRTRGTALLRAMTAFAEQTRELKKEPGTTHSERVERMGRNGPKLLN